MNRRSRVSRVSILVQFWQSTTSTTTQKAAVGLPTGFDGTGTTTNTTAALSGHGTGGALGRAPSITRPRGKDDVGTTTTTGIHNVLAILVGTARLKRKARIAATFTIGGGLHCAVCAVTVAKERTKKSREERNSLLNIILQ